MGEIYGCEIIDRGEDALLVRLQNDIFDTVALINRPFAADEETLVLTDWQGATPETLEEAEDFDWINIDDVDF